MKLYDDYGDGTLSDDQFDIPSFGDVRYSSERELFYWNSGSELRLRPQSLEVLKLLAATPNEIVTKDALVSAVWADLHVGDDSLVQCIRDIRHALYDHDKKIVRTVPKQGYKLIAVQAKEPEQTGMDQVRSPLENFSTSESQPIQYVSSSDGTRIAWTSNGKGFPVLFAPDWGTRSIDLETRSLLYSPFLEKLGRLAKIIRFDRRGNGLSDRDVENFSLEADVDDMENVAEAAGLERFFLLGKYGGTASAIAFAARHPEKIIGIISMTALATGHLASGDNERRRKFSVGMALVENGWESNDPTFLRMVASRLVPNGPLEIRAEIANFYLSTTDKETARRQYLFQHELDVCKMAGTLRVPLLVMHARECKLTPFSDARLLASLVPGARLIALDGENFWPIAGTPEFDICLREIKSFIETTASK